MNTNSGSYYVRVDGRVRGPFSRQVLSSMFGRGRINSDTPISDDRTAWSAVRDLGNEFAAGVNVDESSASIDSASTGGEYFCTVDGITQGPLSIDELQRMIGAGRLEPNDQAWERGQPEWTAAKNIAGLQFPSQPDQARSWVKSQPALFAAIAMLLVLMFGLPTYYVLASASARRAEKLAADERQNDKERQQREQEATRRKESIEERHHQELLDQNRMQHEERMAAMGASPRSSPINGVSPISMSNQALLDTADSPSFSVGAMVHGKGWTGEIKRMENGQYAVSISSSLNELYKVGQEVLFGKGDIEADK